MTAAIPEDIRANILADYSSGMTGREVADRHGVGLASVYRIAHGTDARRGRKFPAHVTDAAVQDYLDTGDSIRVVAGRHPLSEDTLRLELRDRDLTRPSGTTTSTTTREAAVDDFIAGASIATTSRRHGVARSTISVWLADAGVGMEDRDDVSPVDYTGGWVVRGGVRYPVKPVRQRVAA